MRSRFRLGFLPILFLLSSAAVSGQEAELAGGRTELRLNLHLLDDLGIAVSAVSDTSGPRAQGFAAFGFPILETTRLGLALPGGSYHGPISGYLAHQGGFELEWSGGEISLAGFELHPGLPPNAFELRATDGSLVFVLDNSHPQSNADGSEYLFLDMDVRLSEQLARRLGRPEVAGVAVGEAHLRAGVPAHASGGALFDGPAGASGTCVPDYNGPVDVLLESMGSVSENHHDALRVAMAPQLRLQNVGTADVKWFRSISPDGNPPLNVVGQHPFLVMHLYRQANGRIEQIGRSGVKHAFFSANTPPCDCQSDQVLFNDCTDVYGSGTNANRKFLAPREEVTASTGAWTRTGSHFDGPSSDDVRSHDESDHQLTPFEHRLSAAVSDLETPAAEYRVEAWYLVQGDVDIFNSMGHRAVVPTAPPPPSPELPWLFPFDDVGLTLGSALDTWVDPLAPPPGTSNVTISTSPDEGELKLAVIASTLPSGLTHYEYALMNFDFDRRIDSFTIPLPPGATVWNAWFGDGDSGAGADWIATVNPDDITWIAPAGNDLDWGTMFNFAFDTNAQFAGLPVNLGILEAGSPSSLSPAVVAPATLVPISEIEVVLAGSGSGGVTSSPTGVDCGGDCDEIFANGIGLELSATTTAGSAFLRWEESAAPVSLDLALSFTVGADRDLTAVFETCVPDVVLGPQTVGTPKVFSACESITAGTGFVAASEVVFRAGLSIALGDGFTVAAGGEFSAEIVPEQSTLPPG